MGGRHEVQRGMLIPLVGCQTDSTLCDAELDRLIVWCVGARYIDRQGDAD